jgi:sugar lactone lactonase YvrE
MTVRAGRVAGLVLTAVLTAVLVTPQASAGHPPGRIELPDGFLPEGIAIGPGHTAWFGSRADGDIYRADLRTGEGEVFAQGPGTASVGLKTDRLGRLFVAGGPTGSGRIVDTRTGEQLATYQFTTATSFVNDVLITPGAVWFTESQQPQLYAVPRAPDGTPAADAVTVSLGGMWEQGAGFGANGLTATPDGAALLVVHSTSGLLYRVDPATGDATVVDLGGASLANGDGMLLRGRTLYVVLNRLNQIAVLRMSPDGTSGRQVGTITDPGFDVPTTVARFGRSLCLPNARFTSPQEPDTEFWVTCVR